MVLLACYHPLKAWHTGSFNPDTGKEILRITGYDVTYSPVEYTGLGYGPAQGYIEIPCGRCIGCRLEYSRQWANRCMLELGYHGSSYFLTITYDDLHVPRRYYADPDTGVAHPSLSLDKRDVQLFFKRLRKSFGECHIRYFGCGEYGPTTHRPHYHLIVFGLVLDDLEYYKRSQSGHAIYTSAKLDRAWWFPPRDDRGESYSSPSFAGRITVQEVTWECCAYTARYITKKLNGPEGKFYETFNIDPPFTLCSRKPGIGRQYYDDHMPGMMDVEYINVATPTGGRKFRPPRYYHRLYDEEYPEASAELKVTRKLMAEYRKQLKLENTDLNYIEYLSVEEAKLNERIKALKREAN